ncbi:protein phosphatase 2C [Penicillium brasilianum]|uniref:Protein phosphatase n=1 Tax=Penicillium brasilianum TaxID=104259 RepID=A0A1S9RV67_PENBI|nr:protein phosphatase 2C [Penicillium brasilianum]
MIPPSVQCRACSSTCSLQIQTFVRDRISQPTASAFSFSFARTRPSFAPLSRKYALNNTHRRSFHSTPGRLSDPSPSTSRISYRVAVSSSGKGRRFHPLKNAYNFDPAISDVIGVSRDKNPAVRRRNRPDSGEDAFFVSRIGSRVSGHPDAGDAVAFAVADGVGGWTESRVDPADFSHGLCGYMAQSALAWDSPADKLRPKQLLQAGYDQVVDDPGIKAGGSTASVGIALPDGRVELANLGDSGSVLLRLAAVHHYSVPQTHGFNTPYQLSVIPPRMRAQASVFGGAYLEDFPKDAAVTNVQMQHGDVLLLATDGVFDNLNNQDILKVVTSRMVLTGAWTATEDYGVGISDTLAELTVPGGLATAFPPPKSPTVSQPNEKENATLQSTLTLQSLLAASIAGEAKVASVDFRRDGPFAKEAQRYYPGDYYRGGKVDDICALVIVAVDESLASGASNK